jgi:hypothetical protein
MFVRSRIDDNFFFHAESSSTSAIRLGDEHAESQNEVEKSRPNADSIRGGETLA